MIKKILVVILVLFTSVLCAQEGTSSPYSFYGIGLQKFKGTVENRSMGGLSILTDSIHLNLQNPAAYGELGLTTYTLGTNYNGLHLSNGSGDSSYKDNATIEYLAIGIPAGKFGFGFGVIPVNAVGYNVIEENDDSENLFSGSGGLNKVYLSTGFKINKNLNVGLDFNYNFGRIENKNIFATVGSQFRTRELNEANLSGFGFSLGLTYKTMVSEKLQLVTSIVSTPSFKLDSENSSQLALVSLLNNGSELVVDNQDVTVADTELELPAELKVGAGIGEPKKWFVGAEYNYTSSEKLATRPFSNDGVFYDNGSKVKVGGYYIPNYNSLTSYFKRVVYRAGFRYEESGLIVNNESIDEFGISFGIGLPVGNVFSNANLGFELGQRGTRRQGLVKEDFFNVSLSLSLNDRWFRQIKFN